MRDFRLSVGDCIFTLTPKSAKWKEERKRQQEKGVAFSCLFCVSLLSSCALFFLSLFFFLLLSSSCRTQFNDALVCEQNICGLDVAMHHRHSMRVLERLRRKRAKENELNLSLALVVSLCVS